LKLKCIVGGCDVGIVDGFVAGAANLLMLLISEIAKPVLGLYLCTSGLLADVSSQLDLKSEATHDLTNDLMNDLKAGSDMISS
jgi:hypothetical protein